MNRSGKVLFRNELCGHLRETDEGYTFSYDSAYLQKKEAMAVSLTLPLTNAPYLSKTLFAFFDGLIPEGWLLDLAERNWKIKQQDRMGLLLMCCKDCIGAVSVQQDE